MTQDDKINVYTRLYEYWNYWRKVGEGCRERERERERENTPLYKQDKVSSSYHINLHALSAGPLEMTKEKFPTHITSIHYNIIIHLLNCTI